MPISDRDYTQWKRSKRYKEWARSGHPLLLYCPLCNEESLFWNWRNEIYECLNLECKGQGRSTSSVYRPHGSGVAGRSQHGADVPDGTISHPVRGGKKPLSVKLPDWMISLLLVTALSIVGLGVSLYAGSHLPLWLLLGFSFFYSIEKWFYHLTRRHKGLGKLYRLILNLSILSLLGLLIWSGIKVFSQQLVHSRFVGALIFLAEFVLFIWMGRVVSRNSWRWPSMKLTVFCLLAVSIVFAFAGVQPFDSYKDSTINHVGQVWRSITAPSQSTSLKPDETPPEPISDLLPDGPVLRNPSWAELKDFLYQDDTDGMEYVYPTTICYHFAQRLQQNAKAAGWRCALVTVRLEGYPDWYNYAIPPNTSHALNAFETTDRGLTYIDCTAAPGYRGNADKIVEIEVGQPYMPRAIFSSSVNWASMGTVVVIEDIRW